MRATQRAERVALGIMVIAIVALAVVWIAGSGDDGPPPSPVLASRGTAAPLPRARDLQLRPGKDRDLVIESCTTCHSLAPIVRHDGFAPDVWKQEVQKMIKRYGAPVRQESAKRIVAYLQDHYAQPPRPAMGTTSAPGTP